MRYRFSDPDAGTERFYERALMGSHYEPPGVDVHRDDDGVPWFRVVQDCADAFDADDRFERCGDDADGAGGADGVDADSDADSDADAADESDATE